MFCPSEVDGEATFMGADSNNAELLAWVEAELPGISRRMGGNLYWVKRKPTSGLSHLLEPGPRKERDTGKGREIERKK